MTKRRNDLRKESRTELRMTFGVSQQQMALLTGASRSAWSMYESGRATLPDGTSQLLQSLSEYKSTGKYKKVSGRERVTAEIISGLQRDLRENEWQRQSVKRQLEKLDRKIVRAENFKEFVQMLSVDRNNRLCDDKLLGLLVREAASLKDADCYLKKFSLEKKLRLLELEGVMLGDLLADASVAENVTNETIASKIAFDPAEVSLAVADGVASEASVEITIELIGADVIAASENTIDTSTPKPFPSGQIQKNTIADAVFMAVFVIAFSLSSVAQSIGESYRSFSEKRTEEHHITFENDSVVSFANVWRHMGPRIRVEGKYKRAGDTIFISAPVVSQENFSHVIDVGLKYLNGFETTLLIHGNELIDRRDKAVYVRDKIMNTTYMRRKSLAYVGGKRFVIDRGLTNGYGLIESEPKSNKKFFTTLTEFTDKGDYTTTQYRGLAAYEKFGILGVNGVVEIKR